MSLESPADETITIKPAEELTGRKYELKNFVFNFDEFGVVTSVTASHHVKDNADNVVGSIDLKVEGSVANTWWTNRGAVKTGLIDALDNAGKIYGLIPDSAV